MRTLAVPRCWCLAGLVVTAFLSLPLFAQPSACSENSRDFTATGSAQSFTVPEGVTSLTITAAGAGGGIGNQDGAVWPGGRGASLVATVPVTAGESLTVIVGSRGEDGFDGGGGGGATAILRGTTPLLVAGGGGGAGWSSGTAAIADASLTTVAKAGGGATGGAAGAGSGGGAAGTGDFGGAGGGGVTSAGGTADATGGGALSGSAAGGAPAGGTGSGGFGGGGGAGDPGGGGGGGYAGGGGGGSSTQDDSTGGGGSSYTAAGVTLVGAASLATDPEDGSITICWAEPVIVASPIPALDPLALALMAAALAFVAIFVRRS